jgi:photosystem I P700 chlorophyll a apoprotein A1
MTINLPEKEAKRVQIAVDRNPVETSFQKWAKPGHFSRALSKGPNTTTWIWNLHADAHDFDSHTTDLQDISRKVFSAHFGQLGVILIWLSGMYFHGARFSNYEAWLSDPTHIKPSAQIVWPIVGQEILNGDVGGGFQGVQITSGFFQLWRASGITSELQLYTTAVVGLVLAGAMFFAGWFHYHKASPKLEWFQNVESMLNHHLGGLLGLGSLGWAGHQIHVSLPINKLLDAGVDPKEIPLPHEFFLNKQLMVDLYPSFAKGLTPFFTLQWSEYADFLTFKGGLNEVTGGLHLSDTAHHHVAIAVLFLIAGHMYRTNWGIGHSMKEILESHKGPLTGEGHKGLYEILTTSWHAQLAINLALFGSLSIIVAHHQYSMPPYPYLATDYATQLSLFTHHTWIGGFCIVGAGAHAAIFMVRDYDPTNNYNNLLDRVLRHRDAIISHLNWVSIFLGFHSFGLYIHNDTMSALGRPQDMFSDTAIQLQPVFAQWVQNTHFLAPQLTAPNALGATSASWGGDVVAVGGKVAMMPISLGTADFMVRKVMDHVKLRYMLEPLVLRISYFGFLELVTIPRLLLIRFSKQKYSFAKRKELIARANQPETNLLSIVKLGSSETTREASVYLSESISHFQFDDFLLKLPSHVTPEKCDLNFLCWFIGFFEAEGYFSSRFHAEKHTDPISNCQSQWKIDPGKKRVEFEILQKDPQVL